MGVGFVASVREHGLEEGERLVGGEALGAAGELASDLGVGFGFGEVEEFFEEW